MKTSVIKIGIVGPESSGKTTLAKSLAYALDYTFIPEYARLYFMQKKCTQYDISDIINIAKGQLALEIQHANQSLVCDTHLLVCKIWAEVKFGRCPYWINKHYNPHSYAIHFLTTPDIRWEPDPLRENPHDREWLFSLYETQLKKIQANYTILSGDPAKRLSIALKKVAALAH